MNQPALPMFGQAALSQQPHKKQRSTAKAAYHRQRAIDAERAEAKGETREQQVLRLLSRYWNTKQHSPTALELLEFGRQVGESLFDVNSIRPRLNALLQHGLIEPRGKRKCTVSGLTVLTWAVREVGSAEAR